MNAFSHPDLNSLETSPNTSLLRLSGLNTNHYYSMRTKRIVNHIRATFKDGNFQNKITFIKMVDNLIRDPEVSRKFVHLFLSGLADLAENTNIRHVRLQWVPRKFPRSLLRGF